MKFVALRAEFAWYASEKLRSDCLCTLDANTIHFKKVCESVQMQVHQQVCPHRTLAAQQNLREPGLLDVVVGCSCRRRLVTLLHVNLHMMSKRLQI